MTSAMVTVSAPFALFPFFVLRSPFFVDPSTVASETLAAAGRSTGKVVAGAAGKLTFSPQTVGARKVASSSFNVLSFPHTLPQCLDRFATWPRWEPCTVAS